MAQPNQYLEQHMRNTIPYVELTQEIISKLGSKLKTSKNLLTLLRELSVYSGPNQGYNDGLAKGLLAAIKDNSTQDIDKKIVRTSYFLLSDMVSNSPNMGAMQKVSTDLIHHLQYEIKQATGSRLCMAWRLLARMVYICQMEDLVEGALKSAMKILRYPEKEKKLLGQKKADVEFQNQLHFWTALFSSLRRIHRAPSPDLIQVVLTGCRSSHSQLARHAFYLLKSALDSHPYDVGHYFISSLKDGGFLSRASTDVMSCVYLMESCKTFIQATEADTDQNVPRQGPIEDTLIVVLKMLEDSRVKVRVECVRILTEINQGPSFHAALKSIGGPELITRLMTSILVPLQRIVVPSSDEEGLSLVQQQNSLPQYQRKEVVGFGSISLFPLCRACIRLGRYMVLLGAKRSGSSTGDMMQQEGGVESAVRMEELVRPLGKQLGKLVRAFATSSVYVPHARSEVLKALLWIMPDNRGYVAQHDELWQWLQSHIKQSLSAIGEDLTEHLINHIFGRVKASTFYCESLLSMALVNAEEAVKIFVAEGGKSVGMLIQVWQKLQEYGDNPHARELLLGSLLGVAESSMWSTSTDADVKYVSKFQEEQEVSHLQSMQSLRHVAFWALGEYVHLWDYDQTFREGRAVDASELSLCGVMFDLTFPPEKSGLSAERRAVPDLIRVIITLMHALQTEPEQTAKVCLGSLFKIALWCPTDKRSTLRDLIRDEFYEISASAFGLTHPFSDTDSLSEDFDVYGSAVMADRRSCLTNLDRMGLAGVVDRPERPAAADYSTCHFGARKWGSAWHSSGVCREALFYSLALESMAVASNPPRVLTLSELHAKTASASADGDDLAIGGDLFEVTRQISFDLIGDIIEEPTTAPMVASVGDTDMLSGGGAERSTFVVDNEELKSHMYRLTKLIHS